MTSAIIVAAGSSRRMGFNKLLAPLAGVPVLRRTLGQFQACADVAEIIVVAGDEVREVVEGWKASLPKLVAVIPGGAERHLSVWAGIQACAGAADIIAVHDGARPLISTMQISKCITAAQASGSVACARPMTETLKRADAQGRITDSLDRTGVWVMETPQVFQRDLLITAYEAVIRDGALVTDEVSAVQHVGEVVTVVENTSPNPKITFPADLNLAERFLL
ncbi:2-C-methyl-D-erythritol 4-phosphate cytidylyltransferase [Prosthecobacter fusiformis]|uniref:2-C-methyl-D-erythritol 4-phosphate cytidylyltransferase n=1 Tax=Prosthecobacter fusiformis TaxID=48464 RepID=A0A4R7SQL4_9BACT|nr:2-C-methyl-D-erythritol 4-phosphate cytidylyltransferase [Prosthecobacter fusiformis]TDU80965.1 2-C-methyl-D-erythritol 4-phosphate cytidylyltransferase [Prosthecobacter fusiformis]